MPSCDLWGRNEGQLSLQINSWLEAISFDIDFSIQFIYSNHDVYIAISLCSKLLNSFAFNSFKSWDKNCPFCGSWPSISGLRGHRTQWFEPWHNYFFFHFFSSYNLILIYLRTFLRKNKYFSHKIWKIGPWRSLRILRIFSAKVDFCRFMYCFGRFSVLTQNLSTLPHCNVHNIFWNALLL
jgi:hypothetical protein